MSMLLLHILSVQIFTFYLKGCVSRKLLMLSLNAVSSEVFVFTDNEACSSDEGRNDTQLSVVPEDRKWCQAVIYDINLVIMSNNTSRFMLEIVTSLTEHSSQSQHRETEARQLPHSKAHDIGAFKHIQSIHDILQTFFCLMSPILHDIIHF